MRPTKHEIRQALASLIEKGLVVDSGLRRNGQIVWVAVSERGLQPRMQLKPQAT